MRTLTLNENYDLYVNENGDLAVTRDNLSVVRQRIVNKLSLIQGEDVSNNQNGLDLNIIFGDNVPYSRKTQEIKRVILLDPSVVSVDNIRMEADPKLRVGYFTCYITVTVDGESVQTTVGIGA